VKRYALPQRRIHTKQDTPPKAIDFRPISSYSVNKLNNCGRVHKGNLGLNWNASRWNPGTVPPAVTVRTSALLGMAASAE